MSTTLSTSMTILVIVWEIRLSVRWETYFSDLSQFNESKIEPFTLSVSMGYAEFGEEDDTEAFLMHMDEKMYEEKRKYHLLKKSNSSRQ